MPRNDAVSVVTEQSPSPSKEGPGMDEYLSPTQAVEKQMQRVNKLPDGKRWPFGYGPLILSINAGLVGVIGNSFFRRMLMVRKGLFLTSIPSILLPALLMGPAHSLLVTRPALLNEMTCTVCAEIRGGLINLLLGAVYPVVLAAPLNTALANRYDTVKVPSMSFKDFNRVQFVHFWRSKIRYFKGQFVAIAIFQTMTGMFIAGSQMRVIKQELGQKLVRVKD